MFQVVEVWSYNDTKFLLFNFFNHKFLFYLWGTPDDRLWKKKLFLCNIWSSWIPWVFMCVQNDANRHFSKHNRSNRMKIDVSVNQSNRKAVTDFWIKFSSIFLWNKNFFGLLAARFDISLPIYSRSNFLFSPLTFAIAFFCNKLKFP